MDRPIGMLRYVRLGVCLGEKQETRVRSIRVYKLQGNLAELAASLNGLLCGIPFMDKN